jgi:ribosomal protein S15P/S13E
LTDDNDADIKIKFVIAELSRLNINNHPYSCVSLYRVLLEASTKKAYIEKRPKANGNILVFDSNNLQGAINNLTKHLQMTKNDRANVVDYVNKKHIIKTLNNYMHNPKLVDSEIILTSWITMKEYIKACLT